MPENLGVLGALLRDEGYEVRAANSGTVALRYAVQEPLPSLILLDVMMPEMDGFEVLRRLGENDLTRNIPVIFLTALGDPGDVVRGLSQGAADYIPKPIQPEVVVARVRTQLEVYRAREWLRDQNRYLEAEVARRVQLMRKEKKLVESDRIVLHVETEDKELASIIKKHTAELSSQVNAELVGFGHASGFRKESPPSRARGSW